MGLALSFVNVLLWSLLWSLVLCIGAAREPCSSSTVDRKTTVVLKTVHIQTTILSNTTIPVDSGLTLTVDNAPAKIDLITSYFSSRAISR